MVSDFYIPEYFHFDDFDVVYTRTSSEIALCYLRSLGVLLSGRIEDKVVVGGNDTIN